MATSTATATEAELHDYIYELQSENLHLATELEQAHALIAELRASRNELKAELERVLLGCKPPPRRKPDTALKWKFYHEHKNKFRRDFPDSSWADIKRQTDALFDLQETTQDASSLHSQESADV